MNDWNNPQHFLRNKGAFFPFAIGYTILSGLYLHSFLIAHENVPTLILDLFWIFQAVTLSAPNRSRYQDWALILSSIELAIVLAVQVYVGFEKPFFYIFAIGIALCSLVPYYMNKRKLSQKDHSEREWDKNR